MERVRDIDEALFVQMTIGDDRAIRQTWIAGRKAWDRDAAPVTSRHDSSSRSGRRVPR